MITDPLAVRTILVTDCGSTTTKALLFERRPAGWRQTFRGEAPTTVEAPVADVTVGALNAFAEVQELSGRQILASGRLERPANSPFFLTTDDPSQGIDLYLSTSSAGGGLQMMVTGLVRQMSTESAERAALGAGAIVLDAICTDDEREDHEKVRRIRHLRPDILLMTGGIDGGSKNQVLEAAEIILAAAPRPRFGDTLKLPVIYAGNRDAAAEVQELLKGIASVSVVENVRPTIDRENLGPARDAIHEFFLSHVMSHSPGYSTLLQWTPIPIMPTPAAVGVMVEGYARRTGKQVLCADIGGATTDVFSVFRNQEGEPIFNRTVSANYGMSYSVANVLVEAGAANISRWLPYEISDEAVRDRLRNKMIRPTSIPQTVEDLWLEQAVCREALRLSLTHHRSLAVGLSGVVRRRGIADIFAQTESRYELVDMMKLDLVIGSGGVLSHAPHRLGAALMMLDGFELAGVTQIAVDSIFMMPHLGVLASVHPEAAEAVFVKDCIVNIGHSVVPVFPAELAVREAVASVTVAGQHLADVQRDRIVHCKLEPGRTALLTVSPLHRSVDVGAGAGVVLEREIAVGEFGLILDGRNRPLQLPLEPSARRAAQMAIFKDLGLSSDL